MAENKQLSSLEVAYELMKQKKNPQTIKKINEEVLEIKGLDDPEGDIKADLYTDITLSSKFVFLGNDTWDLKERHSLEEWDKDGAAFNTDEEDEEDEVIHTTSVDDYEIDESVDEDLDEEQDEDIDEEYDEFEIDEDDDDNYLDEDEYNDIMDDYENMYED